MQPQTQTRARLIAKILSYPICAIVSLAILANAASVALQDKNSELAIWLNPLNADARVNMSTAYLRKKQGEYKATIKSIIQIGKKYSPINARLISLDGIYQEKNGYPERAQKLFSTSLALLPTEYNALIHKFKYYFQLKKYIKALDIINVITIRWPERQNTFSQFLPIITLDPIGYKHASELFKTSKPLRLLLISSLVRNPVTIHLAVKLIQEWKETTDENILNLGTFVTHKLLKSKKYNAANLAFKSFLTARQQDNSNLVHNGSFSIPFSGNPFDWIIKNQVGVTHTSKNSQNSGRTKKVKSFLEIRFSNKPIQYRNVIQLLKLAPGPYKIKADYFTKSLKTPKPIKISVNCYLTNKILTSLSFTSGDNKSVQSSAPFEVSADNCELVQIYFHTDFLAKSWRNRFSGILGINKISIELVAN